MEENETMETVEEVRTSENTQNETTSTQFDAESFKKQMFDELKAKFEKERAEFEKTKNMKEDEKARYDFEKRVKETEERESQLAKRELRLDAHNILLEKGLNSKFLDILDYSNKENCENSINVIESVFRECVQLAVNEKLKGTTPMRANSNVNNSLADEIKLAMGVK